MSQSALVTGGAKRIGKEIALKLASMGYDIIIHYNTSEKEALNTKKEVESKGVTCTLIRFDLTHPEKIDDFMGKVFAKCENVTLLVNNASIFRESNFLQVTYDEFVKEFNINFVSPFFLSQQFATRCKEGMIINIIDARITKVHTLHFVYNLTKKLLGELTKMAAKTLGPNIRVNGICPGPILPPQGKNFDYLKTVVDAIPLKKYGNVQDIAEAVSYLMRNKFVTGELLFIDGGEHL